MKNDIEEAWNISEGRYEGHRLLVRQNVGARSIIGNAQYPFRLGIAIPLTAP